MSEGGDLQYNMYAIATEPGPMVPTTSYPCMHPYAHVCGSMCVVWEMHAYVRTIPEYRSTVQVPAAGVVV